MQKRFTLAEAEALLPEIETAMREAIATKGEYESSESAFQATLQKIMVVGGMVLDSRAAAREKTSRDRAAERLRSALEKIHGHGCQVKDLDAGLVDFPTLYRGEEVLLCWKLGETSIRFWHGAEEGFAGRKPINQDFLDHHQGDPLH